MSHSHDWKMPHSTTPKQKNVSKNDTENGANSSPMDTEHYTYSLGHNVHPVRNFNWVSMLATCVSLMATWEAFCSTMVSGLISGGPVSLVYGYIIALIGTLATALSLAEAASMFPTAGGQYHFVAALAPRRYARGASWCAGWITTFGWQAVAASAPFLAGTMIQDLVLFNYPDYSPQRWHGTMIYWAILLIALLANTLLSRYLPMIEQATMALHVCLFFVMLIGIVVASPTKNSATFVFTRYVNETGWESSGIAWCIGMLSAAYVLVGYDGATHLSEEMTNAATGVPRAMVGAVLINGAMGFAFLIAILFSMGSLEAVLNAQTGFPIIQVFYNATSGNMRATTAMSSAVVLMALLATIPLVLSAARTLWALARDGAFPFSSTLSHIDEQRGIPTRAVFTTIFFLALLGLINIASTSAFNAIVSLSVVGLYASYLLAVLAILYRRTAAPQEVPYGPFRLGAYGTALNVVSVIYSVFACIFLLFPPYYPVAAINMNYACVILGGVLLFSLLYWLFKGRKHYKGPIVDDNVVLGRALTASSGI